MNDTDFGVAPDKRRRSRRCMAGRHVRAASPYERVRGLARGVNVRIDVSKTYPVDSPDVFDRGGHGLFGTTGDYFRFARCSPTAARSTARGFRPQDARTDAPEPLPPSRCRSRSAAAPAGLRLRPRLAGSPRRRASGAPGSVGDSAGRARPRPTTGSIPGGARRAVHDPVDAELRPARARPARLGLSGDRGLGGSKRGSRRLPANHAKPRTSALSDSGKGLPVCTIFGTMIEDD